MIADKAYGGTVALPLWVGIMKCAAARGYQMARIRTVPASARNYGLRLCRAIRTTPAKARNTGIRLCRVSGMLAHAGCEYEGKAYIETMADFTKKRGMCTVHAELAEDPDADAAAEEAEDPDATPDIDDLPQDDVAEEV